MITYIYYTGICYAITMTVAAGEERKYDISLIRPTKEKTGPPQHTKLQNPDNPFVLLLLLRRTTMIIGGVGVQWETRREDSSFTATR